jgi:hypothetical protein
MFVLLIREQLSDVVRSSLAALPPAGQVVHQLD